MNISRVAYILAHAKVAQGVQEVSVPYLVDGGGRGEFGGFEIANIDLEYDETTGDAALARDR